MSLNISPITDHREREKGVIVYPVYSRRSAGLSIGINLFPTRKLCPFHCPYCEVFPFSSKAVFSIEQLKDDLQEAILEAQEKNTVIKDICFSGSGEPTISPDFTAALKLVEDIRATSVPSSHLVIITNGVGLLLPKIFSLMEEYASLSTTDVWLKVDAGTEDWYKKINNSTIDYKELLAVIRKFVSCSHVTIQTMLCAINDEQPPEAEKLAWESLICEMAKTGGKRSGIRKVQLYGKARPAPKDPIASELPESYLEERAESLRNALLDREITIPVEIY